MMRTIDVTDPLEIELLEVMIAVVVRKPDGLDLIRAALCDVEAIGRDMGVLSSSEPRSNSFH